MEEEQERVLQAEEIDFNISVLMDADQLDFFEDMNYESNCDLQKDIQRVVQSFSEDLNIIERWTQEKRSRDSYDEGNHYKVRRIFTDLQRDILTEWLTSHKDNPYPSSIEVEGLAQQTGLEKIQVQRWFSNNRQRKMKGKTSVPPHIRQLQHLHALIEQHTSDNNCNND